jgi:hypothetical protein
MDTPLPPIVLQENNAAVVSGEILPQAVTDFPSLFLTLQYTCKQLCAYVRQTPSLNAFFQKRIVVLNEPEELSNFLTFPFPDNYQGNHLRIYILKSQPKLVEQLFSKFVLLRGCTLFGLDFKEIRIQALPHCKILTFSGCFGLSDEKLKQLISHTPDLEQLGLKSTRITGKGLLADTLTVDNRSLQKLNSLDLSYYSDLDQSKLPNILSGLSQLTALAFQKNRIEAPQIFVAALPTHLNQLHLSGCTDVDERLCQAIFNRCSQLRTVTLSYTAITGESWSNKMGSVQKLSISSCRNLTPRGINNIIIQSSRLCELNFSNNSITTFEECLKTQSLSYLKKLTLDGLLPSSASFQTILKSCPNLLFLKTGAFPECAQDPQGYPFPANHPLQKLKLGELNKRDSCTSFLQHFLPQCSHLRVLDFSTNSSSIETLFAAAFKADPSNTVEVLYLDFPLEKLQSLKLKILNIVDHLPKLRTLYLNDTVPVPESKEDLKTLKEDLKTLKETLKKKAIDFCLYDCYRKMGLETKMSVIDEAKEDSIDD